MRSRAINWTVLAAISGLIWGCGGDDGDDPDNGGGGKCAITACGGDPVGDWKVDDVCVSDSQKVFASIVNDPACATALKSSSDPTASGNYKLGNDNNAMSTIVVSGTGMFSFNDACTKALGLGSTATTDCPKIEEAFKKEKGVKSATCSPAGANCDCTIAMDISLAGSSSYTKSGNELTVGGLKQPFCVEGGKTLELEMSSFGATLSFTMSK